MILIADSGSTKTNWYYSEGENRSKRISTSGINPFFRTTNDIYEELLKDLAPKINSNIQEIYFYGAGVINKEKGDVIKKALQLLFPSAKIEVESDLLAAARATCVKEKGIACILGTGSNSCLYDGEKIVEHVPPLGFILGDEGSGAVLGRQLVGDYLKGLMPENLAEQFKKRFQYEYSELMESVYKKEKPNKFLAQFVPFLSENSKEMYCSQLVENSFEAFINRNVKQYTNYKNLKINFVGSVAFHFQEQLKRVLDKKDLNPGEILQNPLYKLARFHFKK